MKVDSEVQKINLFCLLFITLQNRTSVNLKDDKTTAVKTKNILNTII